MSKKQKVTKTTKEIKVGISNWHFVGDPKLPLKIYGKIKNEGWDIDTHYAIDSDLNCWMDHAHGTTLYSIDTKTFINTIDWSTLSNEKINELRQILGYKKKYPKWAKEAKNAGWIPPETWNEEEFDII